MRFPHPVLAPETGDFEIGTFDLTLECEESPDSGMVRFHCEVQLTEPSICHLVENGEASVGAFVRCSDTFYSALHNIGWPKGTIEFAAGALLNRVSVRPVIWLNHKLAAWDPSGVHQEFATPIYLERAAILALNDEFVLSVGRAKLAQLESIFSLKSSPELPEGELRVDLRDSKITILCSEDTYMLINVLRHSPLGRAAVLNSVYLPAVMEVLDSLRRNPEAYAESRWHEPFVAKCDATGVRLDDSLFESAQRLLEYPVGTLKLMADA